MTSQISKINQNLFKTTKIRQCYCQDRKKKKDSFTECDKTANLQQFTLILRSGWVLHCFNRLYVLSARQTGSPSLPFPKELTKISYKKHIQNFETWLKHEPLSKSLELSKKVRSSVASTNPQRGSYKHNTIPSDKEHWNIPFGRLWRRKEKFTFTKHSFQP